MKIGNDILRIRIAGGLGNQLFMYFGGLHIALQLKKKPIFDLSAMAEIGKLHPGLNILEIGILNPYEVIENSASLRTTNLIKTSFLLRILRKIKREFFVTSSDKVFRPTEIGYIDPKLVSNKVVEIEAYFQSWRYFSMNLEGANLLSFMERKVSPWVNQMTQEISNKDSLILHVRRGDFLRSQNRWLGVLSKQYYIEIMSLHPEKEVLIFTDSPEEVSREFIGLNRQVKVIKPPHGSDPLDSLILMSRAHTLAISNSTFSWWSAMLAGADSTVYAPEKWFEQSSDPIDLLPQSWIKMPSKWEKL